MRETRRVARRRKLRRLPSLSLSLFWTHIRLIPERKQLLMGMSTRVMLPVFVLGEF